MEEALLLNLSPDIGDNAGMKFRSLPAKAPLLVQKPTCQFLNVTIVVSGDWWNTGFSSFRSSMGFKLAHVIEQSCLLLGPNIRSLGVRDLC
jgi:hypothetical protein